MILRVIEYMMIKNLLEDKPIDGLIEKYIIAYYDNKLYYYYRSMLPENKIKIYDYISLIMELQDVIHVIKGKDIDINSITAYIISLII